MNRHGRIDDAGEDASITGALSRWFAERNHWYVHHLNDECLLTSRVCLLRGLGLTPASLLTQLETGVLLNLKMF